jgi:asparagine synthetase B (glutamine-hydrolysing)
LRELLPPRSERALDAVGVATAWGEHPESTSTCFAGFESLPRGTVTGSGSALLSDADYPWRERLRDAALRLRAPEGPTAVAVSGGLDSALVLALLLAAGVDELQLFTVASGFAGYDELPAARATAFHFGYPLEVVTVGEADFVEALPTCVVAAETALYNLHPVERWLLAKAVAERGHRALVTGDGADQVFAGAPPAIFLPILAALFEVAKVELRSPFFAPEIVAQGWARPADPDKQVLRALAASWGVPDVIVARKKNVRLAPSMDLSRYLEQRSLAPLAAALGRPLHLGSDRERVQWATLAVLWECL